MKHGRLGTVHVFTMSGTSQASAAFGQQTTLVRLATAGQPCHFEIGTTPVAAAATSHVIGASCIDYITVTPGQKIAVLEAGTAGVISITEMA
jgi:hypothetical protein